MSISRARFDTELNRGRKKPRVLWLDHATLGKLNRIRAPGESYSDAILALAETTGNR
jgi:hypothetical protein